MRRAGSASPASDNAPAAQGASRRPGLGIADRLDDGRGPVGLSRCRKRFRYVLQREVHRTHRTVKHGGLHIGQDLGGPFGIPRADGGPGQGHECAS